MVSPVHIRKAAAGDADVIAEFNSAMAFETEGKRLIPDKIGAGVRRLLADPALGFYLVAERDGATIACLMVTTEWSDWRNGQFWWIQSLYVRPAHRRTGVFRAFYAHLRELALADPGVCGFRLYVEKENTVAQRTYEAVGMEETDYRLYEELKAGVVYLQAA